MIRKMLVDAYMRFVNRFGNGRVYCLECANRFERPMNASECICDFCGEVLSDD